MTDDGVQRFFRYARARHTVHLRRMAALPAPWTDDKILQTYRFCNVYRELDRTTYWFRKYVRQPLADRPEVLLATVLFRWFNRISTGEAIFMQTDLATVPPGATAWDEFLASGSTTPLRSVVRKFCGSGPYVTGSYIIKTPDGMDKLTGVLDCVDRFNTGERPIPTSERGLFGWRRVAELLLQSRGTSLETLWTWLRGFPFMGDFMAYEVVTDLRHTALLRDASDIMTWANPGPGAVRGLARIHDRVGHDRPRPEQLQREMQLLLLHSQNPELWPQTHVSPPWEMREVEHTLCEFDKYERTRLGQGRPRQRFHP